MPNYTMKAQISAQIEKLQASNNVNNAKAWLASLTPMQKSVAIALIAAGTVGTCTYLATVGSVTAVAMANGQMAVATVGTAQAFWTAALCGSIAGGVAGAIAHKRYTAAAQPVIAESYDLNS